MILKIISSVDDVNKLIKQWFELCTGKKIKNNLNFQIKWL